MKNRHASISPAEAERSMYVDFEGFANKPPSLLGILVDGSLTQVVLDPQLEAAARAKRCTTAGLRDVATELIRRCQRERRMLVGYSQHERQVFINYAHVDFSADYRDGRMIARRWWSICRPEMPRADNRLKTFLRAIGQPMPGRFGVNQMTARLKAVINMLNKRGSYSALTPVVKRKWKELLDYNAFDCHGMQALVTLAAREAWCAR